MATQIDLGAVVPIGKGDWDVSTTYERANIVRHNSVAWICKVESSTGVEPTEDSSDWYLLVKDTSSVTSVNGQKGDVTLDLNIDTVETPSFDDNSKKPINSEWIRNATGNTTLNAKTADSAITSNSATTATSLGTIAVGSTKNPVYFKGGVPKALTNTVGSSTTPVYFNKGVITSCTSYSGASVNNSVKWNGASKTVSTAGASGGANGDIWFQYI